MTEAAHLQLGAAPIELYVRMNEADHYRKLDQMLVYSGDPSVNRYSRRASVQYPRSPRSRMRLTLRSELVL
jgi:hypothetical protein